MGFTLQESETNSNHQQVVIHMKNHLNSAVLDDTPKNCEVLLNVLEKTIVKEPLINVDDRIRYVE